MDGDRPVWSGPGELISEDALWRSFSLSEELLDRLSLPKPAEGEPALVLKVAKGDLPQAISLALASGAPRQRAVQHPHVAEILRAGLLADIGVEGPERLPFRIEPRPSMTFADLGADLPSWERLEPWVLGALSALSRLHAAGLFFGGLSPSEIGLYQAPSGALQAKISAAWIPHAKVPGRTLPPELQVDDPSVIEQGPWSDLWSLGALLWELFTGSAPGLSSQRPPFAPRCELPAKMGTLLENLLSDEPLGRYDLAADVRVEILALRQGGSGVETVAQAHASRIDTTLDDVVLDAIDEEERPVARYHRPVAVKAAEADAAEAPPQELSALEQAAREVAASGAPKLLLVVGEPGSGRTALVRAFTERLEASGEAETIWVDHGPICTENDGIFGAVRAFVPAVPESRQAAARDRVEARLRREGAAASVARADAEALVSLYSVPPAGRTPSVAAHAARELFRRMRTHAWRGLSCLVLDDLGWASGDDDASALVDGILRRAAQGGMNLPLLIIAVARGSDLAGGSEARDRIARWLSEGAARIDVAPLDEAAMSELASRLGVEPDTRAAAVAAAGGSPLALRLIAELPRDLLPEKPLPVSELAPMALSALSQRSAAPRRLVDLVHLMSLAGRTAPRTLVRHFGGEDLEALFAGCGWYELRGDRYVAVSGALHDALLSLAEARPDRSYLHRRLSRAFAQIAAAGEASAQMEAARHGIAASDPVFAVPFAAAACARAASLGQTRALALASALALEAVEDPRARPGADRASASLWRGRSHLALREYAAAGQRFDEACAAFEARGEGARVAEAQLWAGQTRLGQGDLDAAERCFAAAAARAHQWGLDAAVPGSELPAREIEERQRAALSLEARAIACKGLVELRRMKWQDADLLFARALARSSQLSDLGGCARAVLGQAHAARSSGRLDAADELYLEAIEHFRDAGDPVCEIDASLGQAEARRQRAPDDICRFLFSSAADRAAEIADLERLGRAVLGLGDLARHRGERAEALGLYQSARSLGADLAVEASLGEALLALDARDLDALYEITRSVAEQLKDKPKHASWPRYRVAVAALLALRRDHTQTWQWLWSASEAGIDKIIDRDYADCLILLATEAAAAGWGNVLRLAGKLGIEQLERLGDEERSSALRRRIAEVLT